MSEHFILHHLLPPEPLAKATIHFTRYSSYTRGCDQDNLAASFKYVLDGLKQSRVIVDDNRNHVIPTYDIGPAARNEGFIRIKIEEITLMGIG